jgi:PRC-barrel domain
VPEVVFSVVLPLPLPEPGEPGNGPQLRIGAARRKVRIRRPLSAKSSRLWVLEIEVDVTIPDPEAVLSSSEGFLVDGADGGEIGVVEEVETAPDGTVTALVVAGGWFGRRRARIPVEAIDAITPADRRIVVRG